MPISPDDDSDISNALNLARQDVGGGNAIQARIGGLNQFLTGLDLEANTPNFNTGIGGAGMPSASKITAYHGSPHEFDQFDTSKIGTGEGNQSYGHGLYFAEAEPTARHYQELLSSGNPTLSGRVKSVLAEHNGDENAAKGYIQQAIDYHTSKGNSGSRAFWQNALDQFDDLKNYNKGHMYEVNIDAHPDHFLDWNKPLSEQSGYVQEKLSGKHSFNGDQPLGAALKRSYGNELFGGDIAGTDRAKPNEVSNALSNMGIKGIRYLDAGSSGYKPWIVTHPQGGVNEFNDEASARAFHAKNPESSIQEPKLTHNYVVFDPKDIEIMRRYARGGDVRHGYSVDGMVKPDNNTIEMPHSLEELQNWHKTHPAPKPMVRASDDPTSILYNEQKLDMPNSLQELQNWARVHHASGGNVHDEIAKALHLARKHFDDGGDARAGDSVGGLRGDTGGYSGGSDNGFRDSSSNRTESNGDGNFDGRMGRGQPETGDPIQHEVIGSRDFGSGIDVGGGNFTGHDMPTGLINYTTQRETTPYEGTPMTAAQDPSTAFGMAYPSLVNIQNTPAGAAALLANLGYESTQGGKAFQPNAISSSGYGLAQWTDPTRQAAFFNAMQPGTTANNPIAKMAILGTTTPGQQLGYAMNEIQQKYPSVASEMETTNNIPSATENIMNKYESPATNESLDARIALANQIAKGTGMGSFSQEALNQSPSGNSFAGISPSVSSAVRNAMGAGRGDVGILDSSLAKATALNTAGNTGTVIDEGAVNSPNVTPEATTGTTVADTAPRIPVDSLEDPALIAAYNAQYGLSGPKNTMADMTLGQRIPNVTTDNPLINTVQGANNFLTDLFTPNYKLGSDAYNKISQNPEPIQSTHEGRGGDRPQPYIPYIPPVETAAAAPVAPMTPYVPQTPYVPPANAPYASLGANFIDPSVYQNPYLNQFLASGGKVHGNNALGNAIRMAMGYKS